MQQIVLPPLNLSAILQVIKPTLPMPILPCLFIPMGERLVYFRKQ